MKNIIILICIFSVLLLSKVYAQVSCGNNQQSTIALRAGTCLDWAKYAMIDANNTPIKTIRISVHVFHKKDGTGKTNRGWLDGYLQAAQQLISNLKPMQMPTTSPYYMDSRIRLQVVGVYYWADDNLYLKSAKTFDNGDALYNSIQILIPGSPSGSGGIASAFGNKRWSLINLVDANGLIWNPQTLVHEIGHNCSLLHSWSGDECSDTPNNSNCWAKGTSNPNCDTGAKVSNV